MLVLKVNAPRFDLDECHDATESDSENKRRADLGPPDRAVVVVPQIE